MKKNNTFNRYAYLLFTLSFLLTIGAYGPLAAQDLSSEQVQEVIQSIAKYTSGTNDKTVQLLQKYDYKPPAYLQSEWKQFPAIRKIEMAYEAAETAKKGKGGKRFLALLSKDLAQRYDAPNYEASLKPLLAGEEKPGKIKFKHPKSYGKINVPQNIQRQIMAISKYTEMGALGGTRGLLKHKFGLPDHEVYDILRKSQSPQEALKKGITKTKVPPSHSNRLRAIGREIQQHYQGARYDKALTDLVDGREPSKSTRKATPPDIKERKVAQGKMQRYDYDQKRVATDQGRLDTKYQNFVNDNYKQAGSRKISKMKTRVRGFGGIIFGHEVSDQTNLPQLDHILVIPTEERSPDDLPQSMLEFYFEDGTQLMHGPVLNEDIVAAHQLVFDKNTIYQEGDGLGLAGITQRVELPDSSLRYEIVLHPAIAKMELGWAAFLSDVLPITKGEIFSRLDPSYQPDQVRRLAQWLQQRIYTWKITDVPTAIDTNALGFVWKRQDVPQEDQVTNAFLTMYGFRAGAEKEEFNENNFSVEEEFFFYKSIPLFTQAIYEFDRLNEFAKTFALFRWAKLKGGHLLNPPQLDSYVNVPEAVFITNRATVAFHSLAEEQDLFKQYLKEAMAQGSNYSSQKDLAEIHEEFTELKTEYRLVLDQYWEEAIQRSNNIQALCERQVPVPQMLMNSSMFDQENNEDVPQFDEWRQFFEQVLHLLATEKFVLDSIKTRYCLE